jgi:hypothetical protein
LCAEVGEFSATVREMKNVGAIFTKNISLPLSCFDRKQEIKEEEFTNKISKFATASR